MPPNCDLRPVRPVTAAGSKRHERTTSAQHLHDAHRARAPVLRRTARGRAGLWPSRRTARQVRCGSRRLGRQPTSTMPPPPWKRDGADGLGEPLRWGRGGCVGVPAAAWAGSAAQSPIVLALPGSAILVERAASLCALAFSSRRLVERARARPKESAAKTLYYQLDVNAPKTITRPAN